MKCQKTRHLLQNRKIARKILQDKLELLFFPGESKIFKRQEKIRRRKDRQRRRLRVADDEATTDKQQDSEMSSPPVDASISNRDDPNQILMDASGHTLEEERNKENEKEMSLR